MGLESIEKGANILMLVAVVGVALVIIIGISYINYGNNQQQVFKQANLTNGCAPTNTLTATYCGNVGVGKNYTTNAGAVANTGGTNVNYVYYILFAALVIGLIIAVLVGVVKTRQA